MSLDPWFPALREKALAHVKRCDSIFDGNGARPDKEFAYQQMRLLALELLAELAGASHSQETPD